MILDKEELFFPAQPTDYGKFLVISVGTGTAKNAAMYTAKDAAGWGILSWLSKDGNTPIVDMFSYSSAALVDYNTSILFQALRSEKNYLRIQVRTHLHIRINTSSWNTHCFREFDASLCIDFDRSVYV